MKCLFPNCNCSYAGDDTYCCKIKRRRITYRTEKVSAYKLPIACSWRATAWKQTTCLGSRIYQAKDRETVDGLAKRDFHGCDYVYVYPIKPISRSINANLG
jgi:hypothetical protein